MKVSGKASFGERPMLGTESVYCKTGLSNRLPTESRGIGLKKHQKGIVFTESVPKSIRTTLVLQYRSEQVSKLMALQHPFAKMIKRHRFYNVGPKKYQ